MHSRLEEELFYPAVREGAGAPPPVWPDAIPLIHFAHFVDASAASSDFAIGEPMPGPVWSGSRELKYAFRITGVRLEALDGSPFAPEPGKAFDSAWWWPGVRPEDAASPMLGATAIETRDLALLDWRPWTGLLPLTEPESQALYNLTMKEDFYSTTSYHAVGEILYWYSPKHGILNELNLKTAQQLSTLTGYRVLSTASQQPNGGFRDWFMYQFKRQGYTIEVATGIAPVPTSKFPSIWSKNKLVMVHLAWLASPKSILSWFY